MYYWVFVCDSFVNIIQAFVTERLRQLCLGLKCLKPDKRFYGYVCDMIWHIDRLVQDCSNSSALAMESLQTCTKPSIWSWPLAMINILRPRQNGRHFANNIFNAFSWMKMNELPLKFHWDLFLGVQLKCSTIDVTPLLTKWCYVFLALTHRYRVVLYRIFVIFSDNFHPLCAESCWQNIKIH